MQMYDVSELASATRTSSHWHQPRLEAKSSRRPLMSVMGDAFFESKKIKETSDEYCVSVRTMVAREVHAMRYGSLLGLLDRAVRTIKALMRKQMSSSGQHMWRESLDSIIELHDKPPPTQVWAT